MRRSLTCLLFVLLARPLAAQTTVPITTLQPGARVRITLRDAEPRLGVVVGRVADTLLVRWPEFSNGDYVPLDAVSQIEVSTGGQRNLLKGATVGLLAGAAIGAIAGATTSRPNSFVGRGAETAAASAGCAAIGLVVGTFAALWRGEDWAEVSTERRGVDASVVPRPRGAGLAVSLRY